MERRDVLRAITAAGIGSAVFGRALEALAAEAPKVTPEMVRQAEWIAGITMTDAQRAMMLEDLGRSLEGYAALRAVALDNAVAPAFTFAPRPAAGRHPEVGAPAGKTPRARPAPPTGTDDVVWATLPVLSEWLRSKTLSSTELTKTCIERIERLDSQLLAVITLTRDSAFAQAAEADREIAKGRWRGPLHGVPYGAKDLLAVAGYPTTWGSPLFKDQRLPEDAAVIERLRAAGAVLVAKTSLGEMAMGDVWYGGTTKNPWKLDQGSSGSSAGSSSLVAAGCVPFAIGTETWGSIVSPSTRCGCTGLRPTFGRVSRRGAMALSWTMDKIGAIARSVEDCALVFAAIHGRDEGDPYSREAPFSWPLKREPKSIRLGFVRSLFEADYTAWADKDEDKRGYAEWKTFDAGTLDVLRGLGYALEPVELPTSVPVPPLATILSAEASTAFDTIVRDGRVDGMVQQTAEGWPNAFREGELIPAVEYLRAQRARTLAMAGMAKLFESIDAYVVPSFGGDNLLLTNLTGHPAVVVPNGFRSTDGTPTSITFQGAPDGDDLVLAVARSYQEATGFHRKHPAL
jgi:Asp-tRNA(Asn)/Glu-tRNA(Gln) amidotransferase A subunit family amidase